MELIPLIYSLCDYSGEWPKPYLDAGCEVRCIDIKRGYDVFLLEPPERHVFAVLAAPVCTDFSVSGAQYWPQKDADGRTRESLALVHACLSFIFRAKPDIWALENPVGRLKCWLGEPQMYFDPCDYGDPYTKRTALWGVFNIPPKNRVEPVRVCSQGSWIQRLGGKSERTKEMRSVTPAGFAKAFFDANRPPSMVFNKSDTIV